MATRTQKEAYGYRPEGTGILYGQTGNWIRLIHGGGWPVTFDISNGKGRKGKLSLENKGSEKTQCLLYFTKHSNSFAAKDFP